MLTLFCFPSSGSAASMYHAWKKALIPHSINVIPVEYPARGTRFVDSHATSIDTLCQDLLAQIQPQLPFNEPFAFFGHSIGGLVCFETARLMQSKQIKQPNHLVISSRQSPLNSAPSALLGRKSDAELTASLTQMGGLPSEILANEELMALFLPIIRADLNLNEQYECKDMSPLAIPITTLYGDQDLALDEDKIAEWQRFTSASFSMIKMNGDHFYFNQETEQFLFKLVGLLSHENR